MRQVQVGGSVSKDATMAKSHDFLLSLHSYPSTKYAGDDSLRCMDGRRNSKKGISIFSTRNEKKNEIRLNFIERLKKRSTKPLQRVATTNATRATIGTKQLQQLAWQQTAEQQLISGRNSFTM